MQAAIYRYLIHNQAQLLPLAKLYWYGKVVSGQKLDLDQAEFDLAKEYGKGKVHFDFNVMKQFDENISDANINI